jgi:hypothetical protein
MDQESPPFDDPRHAILSTSRPICKTLFRDSSPSDDLSRNGFSGNVVVTSFVY